jgi:hypothetical protein
MPIIIQTNPTTAILHTTVQDILDSVSRDIRQQLGAVGSESAILIDYCDRVQKELLRLSRWKWHLSPVQTFDTVIGETDYWVANDTAPADTTDTGLGIADLRYIQSSTVFDRTNHRLLYPTAEAPLGALFSENNVPTLWRHDATQTPGVFQVYPPPAGVYTIEFRYYYQRTDLTTSSQTLQVPSDYKDIFVAGVNYYACLYLREYEEAKHWRIVFDDGKRQIVRDMNLHPRYPEFIQPDPVVGGWNRDLSLQHSQPAGGNVVFNYTTVPYSSVPLFNTNYYSFFSITLDGDATSNVQGGTAGQSILIQIRQDNIGGRSWTWGANVIGGPPVGTDPDQTTSVELWFNGTNWYAEGTV